MAAFFLVRRRKKKKRNLFRLYSYENIYFFEAYCSWPPDFSFVFYDGDSLSQLLCRARIYDIYYTPTVWAVVVLRIYYMHGLFFFPRHLFRIDNKTELKKRKKIPRVSDGAVPGEVYARVSKEFEWSDP